MSVMYAANSTTTTFGASGSVGYGFSTSGEGKKVVSPRSLAISPNLDALLEHEERQRKMSMTSVISSTDPKPPADVPVSPVSQPTSASDEFPIGLPPPPPRRTRGFRTPRSRSGTLRETSSVIDLENQENVRPSTGSSSRSNPYINPAPTLEEGFWSRDPATLLASQQSPNGDNLHNSQISQNASFESRSSPISSVLQVRTRSREKLKKSVPSSPDMRGDGDNQAVGASERPPWRRPLLSHAKSSSISSSDSSHSVSTRPPSTAENEVRISISSTIYPPSADSHTHTLFNEPPLDVVAHRDSFMELYSPTNPQHDPENTSIDSTSSELISPLYFAQSTPSDISHPSFALESMNPPSPKPPVPTTPKPNFSRGGLRPKQSSQRVSLPPDDPQKPKPATTNFLDVEERADLVRKSRKLARVFGQTPDANAMAHQDSGRSAHNSFLSVRKTRGTALDATRPLTLWQGVKSETRPAPIRRHSMPLSPDDVSFISIISPMEEPPLPFQFETRKSQEETPSGQPTADPNTLQIRSGSPTSFIDLSEDVLDPPDSASIHPPLPNSPAQSLFETMSVDELEEDRRRKRERLAKLHRFLGSRVPANLVLGIDDLEASLPPPRKASTSLPRVTSSSESDDTLRKAWLKRRRTTSVNVASSSLPDDLERVKEDLDDKEKAINVRRAQKMEKVFGVAPPQTLYHTRHSTLLPSKNSSPTTSRATSMMETTTAPPAPTSFRAPKQKKKKDIRPGTAESSKGLLPKRSSGSFGFGGFDERLELNITAAPTMAEVRHSFIYNHYQHSLNSLGDILDRDDRASLAELHQYLHSDPSQTGPQHADREDEPSSSATPTQHPYRRERRISTTSSVRSDRRRSLPARTSMISLSSEYSLASPKAEITSFQMRRRRAAKLTQFFGVDYRELINDVLESIESGVQHEQQNGTLRAEEVEDLLAKLRNLKVKRQSLT